MNAIKLGAVLFLALAVVSATVPGAEPVIQLALAGVLALVVLAGLARVVTGEVALRREYDRPTSGRPDRETCLVRVDPETGKPWRPAPAPAEVQP